MSRASRSLASGAAAYLRRSRSGVVLLLASLTMVGPFTIDTIFPAFPQIGQELGADAFGLQQTVSVYLASFAVMSLVHGPVSDAVGRKPVIIAGSLTYAVASVVCALAPTMTLLLAGRVLQGACAGAGMIVARTVVRDLFTGDMAQRMMSRVSVIFAVAPAIAPMVGGWMLGWTRWRSIFWLLVAFGVVLGLLAWRALPETHPPENRTRFDARSLIGGLVSASRDARVTRLVAVITFNFSALFLYISSAPAIVVGHFGLGAGDFGALFVPLVAMMMLGSSLTGRLAGRVSVPALITAGFALAALASTADVLAISVWGALALPWAVVGPACVALGVSIVFPLATLALLDLRPRHRGTLSSLQAFVTTGVNAVVAGVVSPLVSASMRGLAAASAASTLLAWAVWAWHHRAARAATPTPTTPDGLPTGSRAPQSSSSTRSPRPGSGPAATPGRSASPPGP